ncbi:MAG TPA: RNA-binding S4 domain-containing protein [Burkholderiaceae bacterium]
MEDSVRIDKWLWAARFFKTRSMAAHAVENGRVRADGERVKPARAVKPGMLLEVDNGSTRWEVKVLALAEVRGSAAVAQALYAETEQSIAKRQMLAEDRRFFHEPGAAIKGRPTKRDRRQIDKSAL